MDQVIVTVGGYGMSHLELWGTVLCLWSVWLVGRASIWTWPVGNVAVVLYAILFWRIRLYADLAEQVYFFVAGFYGWWAWLRRDRDAAAPAAAVGFGTRRGNALALGLIAVGSVLSTLALQRVHLWQPQWFPEPAAYPALDATTTIMSLVATVLMAWRRVECWYFWILIDVAGVGLYAAKEVFLLSAVYALFLVLALKGLRHWRAMARAAVDARTLV